jgi:hypothetical protein
MNKLTQAMHERGIPTKLINLTMMTLHETYAKVKLGNETGEKFRYYSCVKQGDGLSTTLFNIALQTAIKKVDKRGNIFTKLTEICAYADGVAIITRTKNELQRVYLTLEKEADPLGLFTNITKTKYMHLNVTKHANKREGKLCIGDKEFKTVQKFKYLGAVMGEKNNTTYSIEERIQSGNKAHYDNLKLLKSKDINRNIKMNIYKRLLRPVVTYSSDHSYNLSTPSIMRRFFYIILSKKWEQMNSY